MLLGHGFDIHTISIITYEQNFPIVRARGSGVYFWCVWSAPLFMFLGWKFKIYYDFRDLVVHKVAKPLSIWCGPRPLLV